MNAVAHLAVIAGHHSQRSVLRLQGEVDAANCERLRTAISAVLKKHPPLLVVDLSGLGFIDCAGLSVLIWAHKRLAECGHRLVITGANPAVQRLLNLADAGTYLHMSRPEDTSANPGDCSGRT